MKKKIKTRDDRIEELEYDLDNENDFINDLYNKDILNDNDIEIIPNNKNNIRQR